MRNRRYENTRNSGGIGSPPTDCRSSFQGGDDVGGGGALRGRVDFERASLEAGFEVRTAQLGWRQSRIPVPAAS